MYGHCRKCGKRYGTVEGITFTSCEHIEKENKMRKIKWDRNVEKGTLYTRKFPDRAYHNIVTKKAKFFGQLMYCVLKAGGAPNWFRYDQLRNRTVESVLDSLLPNNVNFSVSYDKPTKSIRRKR